MLRARGQQQGADRLAVGEGEAHLAAGQRADPARVPLGQRPVQAMARAQRCGRCSADIRGSSLISAKKSPGASSASRKDANDDRRPAARGRAARAGRAGGSRARRQRRERPAPPPPARGCAGAGARRRGARRGPARRCGPRTGRRPRPRASVISAEVVRDVEVGQAVARAQVLEQARDLGLHRRVEARKGLVQDEQLAARTASARAMASRWRWPPLSSSGRRRGQAAGRPTVSMSSTRAPPPLPRRAAAEDLERLGDDLGGGEARVEGGGGILEDELDAGAERRAARGRAAPAGRRRRTGSRPPVGSSSRARQRASVDLPEPDWPTRARAAPRRMSRSTPARAGSARVPRPRAGGGPGQAADADQRRVSLHARRGARGPGADRLRAGRGCTGERDRGRPARWGRLDQCGPRA